ncbi:hypothetical protein [Cellulomonas sp. NS3]|uniref:hypothetical protein n=1 Tax=Cellulomonas sp. NS3 TaxID=2973977 RepID=UPI002162147F|nr:hypothetical protein [Cellulomonas sp. NS3]
MTSSRRRLRPFGAVLVAALVVGVVGVALASGGDLLDRRPEYTPLHTADELRARPDLAEVLPGQVDATRAVLAAVAATADVTWEPADADVFVSERDGTEDQVVDGLPVLRWTPEHWNSAQPAALDDARVEALGEAVRGALEPRGYTVSTEGATSALHDRPLFFRASDGHDGSVQVLALDDGTLRVIALSSAHVHRGAGGCEPLECRPPVEDPAAGP